jgi:ribosomal protein L37AE/L43A
MGRSFPENDDRTRYHRAQTAAAMRRMAATRQCPRCKRKSALSRHVDGDFCLTVCRWCGYERGGYFSPSDV